MRFRFSCRSLSLALFALEILAATAPAVAAAKPPATVAEAAKVLDLADFPLFKGADESRRRKLAGLDYNVAGSVKEVFEYQRKQLLARKWKEAPGAYVTDQSSSAVFTRDGFAVAVSVSPIGKRGEVGVNILNLGNVDLTKLPLPPGTKPLYAGPASAMFVSEATVDAAREACRKQLLAQGWQPYGEAGDSRYFKQNAVRLTLTVGAAPAQGGKTMITYSSEQLSADLPAPADTVQLQYADITAALLFDTRGSMADVDKFYRQALAPAGWKATTERPFESSHRDCLIFRNPAKDMLSLESYEVEGVRRVTLKFETKAEVDEAERLYKAEIERKKALKDKPLPKLAVAVPKAAKSVEATRHQIEFKLAAGQAKAAVDAWRKQFAADGWTEEVQAEEDMLGSYALKKDEQELTLMYTDTGFLPAEVTLRGHRVELERE